MVLRKLYCMSGKYIGLAIEGRMQPKTARYSDDADAATYLFPKRASELQQQASMEEGIAATVSEDYTTMRGAHT